MPTIEEIAADNKLRIWAKNQLRKHPRTCWCEDCKSAKGAVQALKKVKYQKPKQKRVKKR